MSFPDTDAWRHCVDLINAAPAEEWERCLYSTAQGEAESGVLGAAAEFVVERLCVAAPPPASKSGSSVTELLGPAGLSDASVAAVEAMWAEHCKQLVTGAREKANAAIAGRGEGRPASLRYLSADVVVAQRNDDAGDSGAPTHVATAQQQFVPCANFELPDRHRLSLAHDDVYRLFSEVDAMQRAVDALFASQ